MIPDFTHAGVLPILLEGLPSGSPWTAEPLEFVRKFATSARRMQIARDWLAMRNTLWSNGFRGVQWLDGSYVEEIDREPNDLDVLTFYFRPPGFEAEEQDEAFEALVVRAGVFDRPVVKLSLRLDVQFVDLTVEVAERLVRRTADWCTLWSHRRDELAKGIVQVPLSEPDDRASSYLDQLERLQRNAA